MAGRKAKFYDHVSLLDKPRTKRRRPKWLSWPHGRKRMDAAQFSAVQREAKLQSWAERPESYANRRRKSPIHGMSWAEYTALMAVARVRAEELIDKLLENE